MISVGSGSGMVAVSGMNDPTAVQGCTRVPSQRASTRNGT